MDEHLAKMTCSACRGDEPSLTDEELEQVLPRVPEWELVEQDGVKKLRRTFKFRNFMEALAFTNRVGEAAEAEGHHPIITLTWGKVTVTWHTHKIKGLHENDFIMAAKTDKLHTEG